MTRAEDEILLLAIFGIGLLYAKPKILRERFAVWHARPARGFVVVGVVAVVMIILDGLLEGIMFGHVDDQQKQGEGKQHLQLARGERLKACMGKGFPIIGYVPDY